MSKLHKLQIILLKCIYEQNKKSTITRSSFSHAVDRKIDDYFSVMIYDNFCMVSKSKAYRNLITNNSIHKA